MEETLSSHNPYLLLAAHSPEASYLSSPQELDPLDQHRSSQGGNTAALKDTSTNQREGVCSGDEYLATCETVPGQSLCMDSWCSNKGGKDDCLSEDYHSKAGNVSCSDEESYYSQINCQSSASIFTEATRQNKTQRSPGFNPNNSPIDSRGWIDPVCNLGQGDPALWFSLTPSRESLWQEPVTQKLDSFSEAFLSQHRGALTLHPGPNSSRHHRRVGKAETRTSCVLDSSSSPSPTLPSPSAPLMSYVLSPPPTPLTPPSLSPPNMGSPGTVVGPPSQAVDTLWFFPSHRPSHTRSCGRPWKDPIVNHGNSSYSPDVHRSENHLLISSSINPSGLLPATLSDHTGTNSPQEPGSGRVNVLQLQAAAIFIPGVPFPSILHSRERPPRGHYTPRPLLNPARRGTGLFSSFSPQLEEDESEEKEEDRPHPRVNVGDGFQAKLPPCLKKGVVRSQDKEPVREELLWKPQLGQEGNAALQDHVEKLLLMCSSSCLPGGGSNTELALHCLHCCNGDVMMTLEMLMFTQPSPVRDYHYSGSDVWTEVEKKCFNSAFKIYGKDFLSIQKAVKSKSVPQCVEFYYLTVKPQQKRHKLQKESRRPGDTALAIKNGSSIHQLANATFVPEDGAPAPPLASFYPCKLCGKMFYKIKSRNAHMKIHRQPQEDWTDPLRPQHRQLSNSRLLGRSSLSSSPMTFLPSGYMPYPSAELSGVHLLNSEPSGSGDAAIHSANVSHTKYRELVLHQAWNSEGLEPLSYYCASEGRDAQGSVGEEPINWL
ncbi:uncharacterized protein ACB058_001443 isoform 1-T2 [Synchiropus picturatus]